jgi:hypothetical protein
MKSYLQDTLYATGEEQWSNDWFTIDVTLYLEFRMFQPFGDGPEYFLKQWPVIDVTFYVEFGKCQPCRDWREYF